MQLTDLFALTPYLWATAIVFWGAIAIYYLIGWIRRMICRVKWIATDKHVEH